MKTVVLCSGGLDSVTLTYKVAAEASLCRIVSFDYGQRHKKELQFVRRCATALRVPHDTIDLTDITRFLKDSALTDTSNVEVPDGHYTEETVRSTVVPNRNAIMLAIAFAVAAGDGADAVAAAVHSGDHFIYPDCRPAFVDAFRTMQKYALEGMWDVDLYTPFVDQTKADIVKVGHELRVPHADTWSCFKGGDLHCGRCGPCVERREAFHLAGVEDPTVYEDPEYWMEVCNVEAVARS